MKESNVMKYPTDDLRIRQIIQLTPPAKLINELPLNEDTARVVYETRQAIVDIIHRHDHRLLVIVGPCSIHDVDAAMEYAHRLRPLIEQHAASLCIIMRVYFEKPRTTVGWKGLINDPRLDNSFHINEGLFIARKLLIDLNAIGVPAATEYLDLISPQYISDSISWGAIGARTTESQVHRELASGLSCPVGFKNGTTGNIQIAIDAIGSAMNPHHFLSVTKQGQSAIFSTSGNKNCHIILRGGRQTNYDADTVNEVAAALEKSNLPPRMMIDCSHANSRKQPERQLLVGEAIAKQLQAGDDRIIGVMIESHLLAGRQDLIAGQQLTYGQSITDACLGWEDTEQLLADLAAAVGKK